MNDKRTKADLLASVSGPVASARILPGIRATLEVRYTDGTREIRYHDTPIVTICKSFLRYDSGGFRTPTTKRRINDCLPPGWFLAQTAGVWGLHGPGQREIPFEDGIVWDNARGVWQDPKSWEN